MDRSRSGQKRSALEDYLLDGDPMEDSDPENVEADAGLDDQDLEIARLLGQDV
jgi:hypothetical protein